MWEGVTKRKSVLEGFGGREWEFLNRLRNNWFNHTKRSFWKDGKWNPMFSFSTELRRGSQGGPRLESSSTSARKTLTFFITDIQQGPIAFENVEGLFFQQSAWTGTCQVSGCSICEAAQRDGELSPPPWRPRPRRGGEGCGVGGLTGSSNCRPA